MSKKREGAAKNNFRDSTVHLIGISWGDTHYSAFK
jgi:hypothetical protein